MVAFIVGSSHCLAPAQGHASLRAWVTCIDVAELSLEQAMVQSMEAGREVGTAEASLQALGRAFVVCGGDAAAGASADLAP